MTAIYGNQGKILFNPGKISDKLSKLEKPNKYIKSWSMDMKDRISAASVDNLFPAKQTFQRKRTAERPYTYLSL